MKKKTNIKKSGGASRRKKVETTGLIRLWLKRIAFTCVICSFGLFGFLMRDQLQSYLSSLGASKTKTLSVDREINHVELIGDFRHVEKAQLNRLLQDYLEQGFFKTDINVLKASLEKHPWIDRVNISRHWPDTLKISVMEQQAIARWDNVGFLNQRGEVIPIDAVKSLEHLPLLSAQNRFSQDVMQQYLRVNQLLWPNELTLSELHLDDTLAWTLVLNPDIEIKLGKDNILEKLQALLYAKKRQLSKDFQRIALIDMRYEKGFAVSWQPAAIALN